MRRALLQNLRIREDTIRETWKLLVVKEPCGAGDPAALDRRIREAVEQVFALFGSSPRPSAMLAGATRTCVPSRECGNNPCPGFFGAGEKAFLRALETVFEKLPPAARREIDVGEVMLAVHLAAHRETMTYCEQCPQRTHAPRCRYREKADTGRARAVARVPRRRR